MEASKEDEVQIVLDNASITSKNTSPINGIKAKKLTITLQENSVNYISDSENYTTFTDEENEELNGAIYTRTDLVINGSGKLVVYANYEDGIVSKDGLKIINCTIEITSKDDGIRGKDYIAIKDANINVNSEGDGIKSTNDTDESLGYIKIEGGLITINAGSDAIQAENILNISENANINITTTGEITKTNSEDFGQMARGMFGYSQNTSNSSTTETDSKSIKGLKAGKEITVESGNIEISSTDDSIHSNGIVVINNGTMKLSSEDDGIHADTSIAIHGGNINITKSYEGIESNYIEINGGEISVVSSDDGINISGGNDSSSMNGRMGQNNFSSVEASNRKLVINGGNIKVNATGDGLDANGSMYINGGNVIVVGPTANGNGPLDYDSECVVTGGDIIIYGSTGMWQNPSSNSTQNTLTFQNSGNSGDEVVLKDSEGNEITSFKTEKSYSAIAISNNKIETGKSYTLYVNGNSVGTIQVSSIVSSNLSSSNGMGQGGMKQGGMQQSGMNQDSMKSNDIKQKEMSKDGTRKEQFEDGMKQNMKNR